MEKKVNIGQKAKVAVKWNVHQSNYSKELERGIISLWVNLLQHTYGKYSLAY